MDWTKSYESLMRQLGAEPYGCHVEGCTHVAGGTFRMMLHHKFGRHDR